jgi:menaquinone-dependent protoporphyrinogen oxidase
MSSKVLIVYGTTDGHTKKVAEYMAKAALGLQRSVDVVNAKSSVQGALPEDYDLIIVAASVHAGRYQRAVKKWVHRHAAALNEKPTAFVSVCLAALDARPETAVELERVKSRFTVQTGWQPTVTQHVAGALPYARYGFLKKWLMKRIARKQGYETDTSRNYEYTDWSALHKFTQGFLSTHKLMQLLA